MTQNTEHQPKTTIETPSTHETRSAVFPEAKESKIGRKGMVAIMGGLATTLLAGGLGAGMYLNNAENKAPQPAPEPSVEAPVVPGEVEATPTVEPTTEVGSDDPTNVPEEEPSIEAPVPAADVEALKSLSFGEFDTLPRQEQLVFVADRLDEINGYVGEGGELLDYNPLDIADINNDGNQIVKQWQYVQQTAFFQRDMTDLVSLDKNAAKKTLAGAYYYTNDMVTGMYSEDLARVDGATNRINMTDEYTVTETSDLLTGTDRDGQPIQYRDVDYHAANGIEIQGRFVFTEYTDKDGEQRGIWQAQQLLAPDRQFTDNF